MGDFERKKGPVWHLSWAMLRMGRIVLGLCVGRVMWTKSKAAPSSNFDPHGRQGGPSIVEH